MTIIRKTYGFNKKEDWISLKQLSDLTGISIPHICRTINELKAKNMIIRNGKITGIQKDYKKWNTALPGTTSLDKLPNQALPHQAVKITKPGSEKLPNQADTKETIKKTIQKKHIYKSGDMPKEQIEEIIIYLNKSASKNFRSNKADTIKSIKARLNEGYKIDDLKKVIDIKTSQWKETEWDKYLRPKTLFGNKFEDYLNEKIITKKPKGTNGLKPKTI